MINIIRNLFNKAPIGEDHPRFDAKGEEFIIGNTNVVVYYSILHVPLSTPLGWYWYIFKQVDNEWRKYIFVQVGRRTFYHIPRQDFNLSDYVPIQI